MKNILFSISYLFLSMSLFAQSEFGVHAGMMSYKGEMYDHINFNQSQPAFGAFFRYQFNDFLAFRLSASMGSIAANDADADPEDLIAAQRRHQFETSIIELATQLEYHFLDFRNETKKRGWTPYLFGGIGFYKMKPKLNTQPDYQLTGLAIPFGAGMKFALGEGLNLGLEFGARKTFSDYLDDIHVDKNLGLAGPRDPKYYSENPDNKDMYFVYGFTLSYGFYKLACPKFRR